MTRTSKHLTLAAPLVGLALALSACGGGSTESAAPAAAASASAPAPAPAPAPSISAEANDTDKTFIIDMEPHHSGALAMTELAPTRAGSADVKAIAARIAAEQGPELERMKAMAEAWNVDLGGTGHVMGNAHAGMGNDDAAVLTPLTGAAFDKAFLTRMIAHHTGAIAMSEAELAGGENPQGKELAEQIIAAQRAEIGEMTALLAKV